MRVVIAGASGFLGSALVAHLRQGGHQVTRLVRHEARKGDDDPVVPKVWLERTHERALEGVGLEDLKRFAVDADKGGK